MTGRVRAVYACSCCAIFCLVLLMAYADVHWKTADMFATYTVSIQFVKHGLILLPALPMITWLSLAICKRGNLIYIASLPLALLGAGAILASEVNAEQRLKDSPLSHHISPGAVEEYALSTDWDGNTRWFFVIRSSEHSFSRLANHLKLQEWGLASTFDFRWVFPKRTIPNELIIFKGDGVSACEDPQRGVFYVRIDRNGRY